MLAVLSEARTHPPAASGSLVEQHRRLLARVAAHRDRDAFAALFVHFGPRIKSLLMKAGADPDLAEDIVQDVMTNVWRKVALYDPSKGSVSAWIYAIARNARIDRLRRRSAQPYEDIDELDIASDAPDGEDEAQASQIAGHLAEALAGLPGEQREVIDLAFAQDLSQSEIAARLSVPLGTVKSRMRLAYGRLKTKLEPFR